MAMAPRAEAALLAESSHAGGWLVLVGVATILAGLLFGYDQGVISGALSLVGTEFRLGPLLLEVVTSWVTLGALGGALLAGSLADRRGRQKTNCLAGVLFVVGAFVQALTPGPAVLVAGRLVIGLGVASVAAPLYAAEMAPAEWRGRFVSTSQLAITIGILVAYVADAVLTPSGAWRWMFGLAVIPGALLALGMLAMPETRGKALEEIERAWDDEDVRRLTPTGRALAG